jgi:hypothetical protein
MRQRRPELALDRVLGLGVLVELRRLRERSLRRGNLAAPRTPDLVRVHGARLGERRDRLNNTRHDRRA